jgi:signal transduction histidine kinase
MARVDEDRITEGLTAATARVAPDGAVGDLERALDASRRELEAQNAALARLAYQLRAVLDSTVDGILLTDLEGNVQLSNRPMLRFVQELEIVREGTAVDRLLSIAPKVVDRQRFEETMARLRDHPDEPSFDEFELLDPRRTFQGFTGPVRGDDGATVGRVWTLREVTQERDVERLKDYFVATVSHELRTPLTSMMGFLELVREGGAGPLTADQERFLEIVHRSSERLRRLVGDLLFVARLDAKGVHLDVHDVDVNAVAAEAVEAVGALARARAIEVRHEPGDIPPVRGDRARLSQVVDNLLSNAIKFTPTHGRVTTRTRREPRAVVLEVEDTGVGIPREEQERLFQRFFRSSSATAQAIPGTGLGLVISKAIVEAHGGEVSVASEHNAGTCVRVTLPLR